MSHLCFPFISHPSFPATSAKITPASVSASQIKSNTRFLPLAGIRKDSPGTTPGMVTLILVLYRRPTDRLYILLLLLLLLLYYPSFFHGYPSPPSSSLPDSESLVLLTID